MRPGPRESRALGTREVFTCLGPIELTAAVVGLAVPLLAGRLSCRRRARPRRRPQPPAAAQGLPAAADLSFDRTRENLLDLLGVSPASETLRVYCERQAGRVARWQGTETASAEGFRKAEGGWEFAVDAGKVNTREAGWRDLKIAVAQKRPTAEPATPDAMGVARVARGHGAGDVGRHLGDEAVPPVVARPAEAAGAAGDGAAARAGRRGVVDLEGGREGADRVPPDAGHLPRQPSTSPRRASGSSARGRPRRRRSTSAAARCC